MRGSVQRPGEALPIAAEITIEEGTLRARAADRTYELPLAELVLSPGGFDADFVFCRPADASFTIAVNDPGFVPALSERADDRLRAELAKVRTHVKKHHTWRWIGIASVAVGITIVGLILYSAPRMLAASVDAVPISVDRQLGDAAIGEVELAGARVEDPAVRAFVDELTARLSPHAAVSGFEFRVRVVESEQVNAFALPGGQMVLFTGLIARARRPEEVAGVLAHEMSHVTLRHGLRNVAHRAGMWLALSLLIGDSSGWLELATDVAVLAQSNDYSRDQESAADAEGVRMLRAAGIDPGGLADFFRLLEDEPGSELEGALSWLSTHPDHRARIAHVEALARALPGAEPRPLSADWAAVQRAVAP